MPPSLHLSWHYDIIIMSALTQQLKNLDKVKKEEERGVNEAKNRAREAANEAARKAREDIEYRKVQRSLNYEPSKPRDIRYP